MGTDSPWRSNGPEGSRPPGELVWERPEGHEAELTKEMRRLVDAGWLVVAAVSA